ncbi:hypothetical protein B0H17DRAFT_1117644 [Mycena rosella]|uniref:Uncharacterized protein n=1 Tax=Mycena rosella TaxID=1033263 RepID=A0AAD7B5N6_MYCRO|nr:hypothetical protein B0H17DRAFT_1117644 [Mycena rosella]
MPAGALDNPNRGQPVGNPALTTNLLGDTEPKGAASKCKSNSKAESDNIEVCNRIPSFPCPRLLPSPSFRSTPLPRVGVSCPRIFIATSYVSPLSVTATLPAIDPHRS